jgi:hypothetical protein
MISFVKCNNHNWQGKLLEFESPVHRVKAMTSPLLNEYRSSGFLIGGIDRQLERIKFAI